MSLRGPRVASVSSRDIGSTQPQFSVSGTKLEPARPGKNDASKNKSYALDESIEQPEREVPEFRKPTVPKSIQMAKLNQRPKETKEQPRKSQSTKRPSTAGVTPGTLTKDKIFDMMGITNPETEQLAELSKTQNFMATGGFVGGKKDVQRSVIENLEKEIQKLKMKNDNIQDRQEEMMRQELERQMMEQQALEDEHIVLHEDPDRIQKFVHHISSLEKPTLENVLALKRVHEERMKEIEQKYMEKQLRAKAIETYTPLRERGSVKTVSAGVRALDSTTNKSFEHQPIVVGDRGGIAERIPFRRTAPKKVRVNKEEQRRSYNEKFAQYLEHKKEIMEARENSPPNIEKPKDFDRYRPTSPNRNRAVSPNKWDAGNIVDNEKKTTRPSAEKKSKPIWGEEVNQSVDVKAQTKKPEPKRAQSAKRGSEMDVSTRKASDLEAVYGDERISESEIKLLHWVFNIMQKDENGSVSKDQLLNYIEKSPEIIELYELNPSTIRNDIFNYQTKVRGSMSFNEFLSFLSKQKSSGASQDFSKTSHKVKFADETLKVPGVGDLIKRVATADDTMKQYSEHSRSPQGSSSNRDAGPSSCLLPREILDALKEIFENADRHGDLVVKRSELLTKVRADVRIIRSLHKPAVHIPELNKKLPLERILNQIEQEEKNAKGDQKKAKEYISLNQFMKYFTNYHIPVASPTKGETRKRIVEEIEEEDDQDYLDLTPDVEQYFKNIFEALEKHSEVFVELMEFLEVVRRDERYNDLKRQIGRKKAQKFDLEPETVGQTLDRMEEEADQYIEWQDFLEFFSRRGRPKSMMRATEQTEKANLDYILKGDPEDKEAQTIGKTVNYNHQRDGYDSDPEFHTYSKEVGYEFKLPGGNVDLSPSKTRWKYDIDEDQRRKSLPAEQQRKGGLNTSFQSKRSERGGSHSLTRTNTAPYLDKRFGAVYKDTTSLKYSIPEPFEFDTREKKRSKSIRERKLEEDIRKRDEELENLIKHRFRAKSVPLSTTQPLFEKKMIEQEEKRRHVKENSIAITRMREKPFSFYARDFEKYVEKKKQEPPLNQEFEVKFKANPIPQMSQVTDVWKKMEEEEDIIRKERVSKRAQENLVKASLPPRMAKHEKERREKLLREQLEEKHKSFESSKHRSFSAKPVPDFEKLHKSFQTVLDQKKMSKRTTQIKEFAFQEARRVVTREYLDIENQYLKHTKDEMKRDPFEAVEKLKNTQPKIQPSTTMKMVALTDLRKKEREEKEKRQQQLIKEQEAREAKRMTMKPIVQQSPALVDKSKEKGEAAARIREQVRAKLKADQEKYNQMKAEMDQKIASRPLLIEQESERSKRMQLQSMKDLARVEKIFKEAGMKNTKQYFTSDENEKIEDAKFLEKHGFKKEFEEKP